MTITQTFYPELVFDFKYNKFFRPPSKNVVRKVLAASTAETITTPTGMNRVVLTCPGATFYATFDGTTATIPAVDDELECEPNGTNYYIGPNWDGAGAARVASISVISATAGAVVTAAFYQ